jgi:hypothetical protein
MVPMLSLSGHIIMESSYWRHLLLIISEGRVVAKVEVENQADTPAINKSDAMTVHIAP